MRFFTAAASLAIAGAASAAVLPRATEHKVYVDTSACADNGRTLPQFFGISNSTSQDFTDPARFDGPTFTFTVPAYYQGHLWLYDSDNQDASSGALGPLNVQGVDVYFYDQPTEVEHNSATIAAEGSTNDNGVEYYVPDPITAVRFASTSPSSKFIEGKTGGSLESTQEGDALYVYYCVEWPVQN